MQTTNIKKRKTQLAEKFNSQTRVMKRQIVFEIVSQTGLSFFTVDAWFRRGSVPIWHENVVTMIMNQVLASQSEPQHQ